MALPIRIELPGVVYLGKSFIAHAETICNKFEFAAVFQFDTKLLN